MSAHQRLPYAWHINRDPFKGGGEGGGREKTIVSVISCRIIFYNLLLDCIHNCPTVRSGRTKMALRLRVLNDNDFEIDGRR